MATVTLTYGQESHPSASCSNCYSCLMVELGKKLKMLPKLSDNDAQKIKEIDFSVANKWKFAWLDCSVSISQY